MLVHPQFNPIALQVGPLAIHWYGLTYLAAFGLFLALAIRRTRLPHFANAGWTRRDVEDLLFYGVLGVVIGGRLGYVLFYKPGYYAGHPFEVFAVWKGGMAFHGGLLGVIGAMPRLRARARPLFLRRGRSGRALRADRPWPADASATSSMASCGGARPTPAFRGRWCSLNRAATYRAIHRRSTSSRSRACCSSCCSGSMP